MADKHIQMQRKRADGGFDKYYPKTKVELVEGAASKAELDAHKADSMPHKTADGGYRWGLRINPDLSATIIYEVVE